MLPGEDPTAADVAIVSTILMFNNELSLNTCTAKSNTFPLLRAYWFHVIARIPASFGEYR